MKIMKAKKYVFKFDIYFIYGNLKTTNPVMRCLYYLDVLAGKCIRLVTQSDSIYERISI